MDQVKVKGLAKGLILILSKTHTTKSCTKAPGYTIPLDYTHL